MSDAGSQQGSPVGRRPRREQIHPHLPAELRKRLRTYAAGKGASQASVVQAALDKYLDGGIDANLILRRLDRLTRGLGAVHRDVRIVADAFAVFVQVWLAHTPRIPDGDKARAERAALARFAQFTEHVAMRVASGRSVLADLGRDAESDTEVSSSSSSAPPDERSETR